MSSHSRLDLSPTWAFTMAALCCESHATPAGSEDQERGGYLILIQCPKFFNSTSQDMMPARSREAFDRNCSDHEHTSKPSLLSNHATKYAGGRQRRTERGIAVARGAPRQAFPCADGSHVQRHKVPEVVLLLLVLRKVLAVVVLCSVRMSEACDQGEQMTVMDGDPQSDRFP